MTRKTTTNSTTFNFFQPNFLQSNYRLVWDSKTEILGFVGAGPSTGEISYLSLNKHTVLMHHKVNQNIAKTILNVTKITSWNSNKANNSNSSCKSNSLHLSRGIENQYSGFSRWRLYGFIGLQHCWCPLASSPIRKHRYLGRSSKCTAGRATSSVWNHITPELKLFVNIVNCCLSILLLLFILYVSAVSRRCTDT